MAQRFHGEGTIYWSPSMRRLVGSFPLGTDGAKRKRKTFYGPIDNRSRAARLGIAQRMDAFAATQPRPGKGVSRDTFAAYATRYITSPNLRGATRKWYGSLFSVHVAGAPFAAKDLRTIQQRDVRTFLEGLTVGVATARGLRAMIHRVFEVAIKNGDLAANPAAGAPQPRLERAKRAIWTPNEALLFLRAMRGHALYPLYLLALTTTMGPAELLGLQWSSVQLDDRYLVVEHNLNEVHGHLALEPPKNRFRVRRIDLPEASVLALRALPRLSPYVFTSQRGAPMRRKALAAAWKSALDAAEGVALEEAASRGEQAYQWPRIAFYALRHTANALMGHLGVPIAVASERMGHSSIQQTVDTYGHLYRPMQRDVADRLERFLASEDPDSLQPIA